MSSVEQTLNPLARELNETLVETAPEIHAMLSALGKRLYFPKGILSQSAEAKQKAHRFNATIGIATEKGKAMHLASVQSHLVGISPDDAFTYAAAVGPAEPARALAREAARGESLAARQGGRPPDRDERAHARPRASWATCSSRRAT